MRIAIVTTSYPSSADDPAGHFVAAEARELARAGHSVTVFAPARAGARPHQDVAMRWVAAGDAFGSPGALARLRARPTRLLGAAGFAHRARRELRDRGPFDRIVAHWLVPSAWPIAFGLTRSLEVVVHGSDVGVLEKMPEWAAHRIVRSLVRCGATFRFVSSALRDRASRATRTDVTGCSTVKPCAIDVDATLGTTEARALLGIDPSLRLVAVVGRLVPSKRLDVALGAARLVPGAEVVVVGDGPERRRLERDFPRARFVGHVPRSAALAWIAAADVLLSASHDEGAPTVVREARTLGTPVVAAPAGDLMEWSRDDPGIAVIGA